MLLVTVNSCYFYFAIVACCSQFVCNLPKSLDDIVDFFFEKDTLSLLAFVASCIHHS